MPPLLCRPLPLLQRFAVFLAAAAASAAVPLPEAALGPTIPGALDGEGCDVVGLVQVQLRRLWQPPRLSMDPSSLPRSPSLEAAPAATSSLSMQDEGAASNHGQIVVAKARAIKASSLVGSGAPSFGAFSSPADMFMPTDGSSAGGASNASSQLPIYLQALAQAQLWITCAGGIMVAFALNRARAVLNYYAQQHSQVNEGSFVSWRIDPRMVHCSALNSAG